MSGTPFNFQKPGSLVASLLSQKVKSYYPKEPLNRLAEIDDKFGIFFRGQTVVELGGFPGTSLRYIADQCLPPNHRHRSGKVIGIDQIKAEVPGVDWLQADVVDPQTVAKLIDVLGERSLDVLVSDLAPRRVGIRQLDHDTCMLLLLAASQIMENTLVQGGTFVSKFIYGKNSLDWTQFLKSRFEVVNSVRPERSRGEEEMYFVARGYCGRPSILSETSDHPAGTKREGYETEPHLLFENAQRTDK